MNDVLEKFYNLNGDTARLFAESIVDTIHEPLMVLDSELRVISVNSSFYSFFKVSSSEIKGKLIYDLGNRQWDNLILRKLLEDILPESSVIKEFEITHSFPVIGEKTLMLNISKLDVETLESMILISINDITEFKRAEDYQQALLEKDTNSQRNFR